MQLYVSRIHSWNFHLLQEQSHIENGIQIWLLHQKDCPLTEHELTLFSQKELLAAERFQSPEIKMQHLRGHLLIKRILSRCTNSPEQEIQLQKKERGKLYWDFPLHFNLSHSGEWIVAAFSFLSEVGIDIEYRKKTPRMESIVRHFFHPDEIEIWLSTPETEQKKLFFQYWTMKEALLKATGDGLYASTKDFSLKPMDSTSAIWYAKNSNHRYDSWLLESFSAPEDYTGSVSYRVRKN